MTTKQSIALATLTALIGGWVGWQFHPATELNPGALRQNPAKSADAKPVTVVETVIESETDTSALDSLRAELAAEQALRAELEAQVAELAPRAQRYDYLKPHILNNDWRNYNLFLISQHELQTTESTLELLDLDPASADQLKALNKRFQEKLKDWESEHATISKVEENHYRADLPPYPDDLQSEYHAALKTILNEEDANLVNTFANDYFKTLNQSRRVEVDINEYYGGESMNFMVTAFKANGNVASTSRFLRSVDEPYSRTPDRWDHLIRLEGEPE